MNNTLERNNRHAFAMRHSIVLYKRNALFTFIPKNGCSTLRLSAAIDNGCIDGIADGHWIHANNNTFNPSLRDAIAAEYSFVVLRCPFRRLASVFLDKFVAKEVEAWRYRDTMERQIELDNLTFRQFALSLDKKFVVNSNIHWRPQVDFLLYEDYSDYFNLENFQEATQTLAKKIGLQIHDARTLTNHGTDRLQTTEDTSFPDMASFDISVLKRNGQCPSHASLFDEELINYVAKIYDADIQFYKSQFGSDNLLFKV